MKIRPRLFLTLLAGATALATAQLTHAQIVNINARVSGAQPGLNQVFWHDPFAAVSLSLAAGTYDFKLVDPATQAGATFTAWTYNAPWITNYIVFDSANLTHELFDGAVSVNSSNNAQSAFDATIAVGHGVTFWTFSAPITLLFAIPDSVLADNTGGVSISITPAVVAPPPEGSPVPEPSTCGLIAGLVLLGGVIHRRASARRIVSAEV